MNDPPPAAPEEDAAWASLNTPLSADELLSFCRDIERLFRINPMLEFRRWEALREDTYAFSGRNSSQDPPFDFDCIVTVEHLPDGIRMQYDRGVKSDTTLTIEPAPQGSKLTITDRYTRLSPAEREDRMGEVDKSLVVWAKYLQRSLVSWNRHGRSRLWRWYMRRVWQPMKPSARRITYMLLAISAVEVALILLGVGIYYAEYV